MIVNRGLSSTTAEDEVHVIGEEAEMGGGETEGRRSASVMLSTVEWSDGGMKACKLSSL